MNFIIQSFVIYFRSSVIDIRCNVHSISVEVRPKFKSIYIQHDSMEAYYFNYTNYCLII